METPTMLQLREQYKGKTTAEFILYSYNEAKDKDEAHLRFSSLLREVESFNIKEDFDKFLKEEILHFINGRKFWKRDAGSYAYLFYDYFVLGFGDRLRLPPSDEKIFSIFNCVTYGLVTFLYNDSDLYRLVKRSNRKFIFF